jgi:glycosyltransferase involved in cell wall biosynthesis
MKVLLCHNYYQQRGGEDASFDAEAWLLEAHGHEVVRYTCHNDEVRTLGRIALARRTVWNGSAAREIRALIAREQPDVMHCTNTFPLLSPSVYYAARAAGVPMVQSLRNYRPICVNSFFERDGRVCEDCLGAPWPWRGVAHGCYRADRAATAVLVGMLGIHGALGTWRRAVTLYITPSDFARRKYGEGGWPIDRIRVKPNFLHPDPGPGAGGGGHVAFVGRLSREKGIEPLLAAWERLDAPVRLLIAGDGPLAGLVRESTRRDARIQWLGRLGPEQVLSLMAEAAAVVVPAVGYETFGRTIMEAFAVGTPVIASRIGPLTELVEDGRTGGLVEPGDPRTLAGAIARLDADRAAWAAMRAAARRDYERKYTASENHSRILAIYHEAQALGRARAASDPLSTACLPATDLSREEPR